jgi:hypothetical protein
VRSIYLEQSQGGIRGKVRVGDEALYKDKVKNIQNEILDN